LEKHSNLLNALNVASSRDTLIVAVEEKQKEKAKKVVSDVLN